MTAWIIAYRNLNKQFPVFRFSHSPLIDEDDEEEAKEPMLNEAIGEIIMFIETTNKKWSYRKKS